MSASKHKLKRQVSEYLRGIGIHYQPESSYPNAAKQVRQGGRRIKGTQTRIQDRLASGMIIYLPNVDTVVEGRPQWTSKRMYLMYFGESVADVELSIAQLQLFNPFERKDLIVIYCRGERPS